MVPIARAISGRQAVPALRTARPTTDARSEIAPSAYFRWKGILGWVVALLLMIPAVPLIGLLILLVRLSSHGSGIFRQARVGMGGRQFTMYKIRTMRQDAESESGPTWSPCGDSRVTFLGGALRKFHLDELPQLLNVLRGEMTLIGPRPERPEFVAALASAVPGYLKRLAVAPGVTGLAQLNLPADTDLETVRRKVSLDVEYIQTATFWLDVRIFICTLLRILKINESFLLWVMALRRKSGSGCKNAIQTVLTPETIAEVALAADRSTPGLESPAPNRSKWAIKKPR